MFSDLLWWPPQGQASSGHNVLYDQFFSPNSRALLPTFPANCPDGSHFAQVGSHFAQNTAPNLCSSLSRHTSLSRICTIVPTQNTPKPTPKHPLFWPALESGQIVQWAKRLKSGQNFSRSGQIFFFICFMKWKCSSKYLLMPAPSCSLSW